jgi:hypothetical protein
MMKRKMLETLIRGEISLMDYLVTPLHYEPHGQVLFSVKTYEIGSASPGTVRIPTRKSDPYSHEQSAEFDRGSFAQDDGQTLACSEIPGRQGHSCFTVNRKAPVTELATISGERETVASGFCRVRFREASFFSISSKIMSIWCVLNYRNLGMIIQGQKFGYGVWKPERDIVIQFHK